MNADRIIVVANGGIAEEGSHEDLIRAGGKYAELWSKQVFVRRDERPDTTGGGRKGKRGKLADLVNDLTPEAASTELAKVVNKTAATPVGGGTDDAARGHQAAALTMTPSGHKKEVYTDAHEAFGYFRLGVSNHFLTKGIEVEPGCGNIYAPVLRRHRCIGARRSGAASNGGG